MTSYAVDVQDLTKIFAGKTVVDHITLRIPEGKVYGFLGPNGSGKTTSIRMICGLLTPDAGAGQCLGFDVRKQGDQIRRRTGYMTQKFSLWEDLSVQENLLFVADMFCLSQRKERVETLMHDLNLTARASQMAGSFSGGWKQRLALAACVLHEPKLLLLDEPTAGVDPKARREFWDEIHKLAERGLTVLVSTHYMDEAERCHAIIYLSYGKIVAEGTVEEVIDQAGLTTWAVSGLDLMPLMRALAALECVSSAAPFGSRLHVSGTDEAALQQAIAPYQRPELSWQKIKPSLEDVFIHSMASHNQGESR